MKQLIHNKQKSEDLKSNNINLYNSFKETLEKFPFIFIIGKYDHILGPLSVYSSVRLEENQYFIRNLLRDALNTKNKFVILDFDIFYSQIYKIEIEDNSARGKKQLYSIILIRDVESPLIPIIHFRRIEMMFRKIGDDIILLDDTSIFHSFFNELCEMYIKKNEILPLEFFNLQIRSGVNTIQGFCELILESNKRQELISDERINSFLEMILDSCNDIIKSLEKHLKNGLG